MASDMDADVVKWILEYLPRLPIDDHLLNMIINIIPHQHDDNPGLKKSLLLRKLESEIAKQSISEAQLDLLQQLQELDPKAGSIKVAYLATAVECSVNEIRNSGSSRIKYFDVVERIWDGRVCKLENTAAEGLISDDLLSWMNDIEAGLWDDDARRRVLKRSEGIDAIQAISLYVKEERGKMGPSFLESVAREVRVNHKLRTLLKDKGMDFQGQGHAAGMDFQAHAAGMDFQEMLKTYHLPTSPEVNRVKEALVLSSMELHAVVEDPLPDALRIAQSLRNTSEQANGESMSNHSHIPRNNASKSCFMARNGTACPFELNDSIDDVLGVSSIGGSRVQLPSPKKRAPVSPLKPYVSCKLTRRRTPKKWTALEEDTLRAGVKRFGRGNWVTISKAYKDILAKRTPVDLKDKWRNLGEC